MNRHVLLQTCAVVENLTTSINVAAQGLQGTLTAYSTAAAGRSNSLHTCNFGRSVRPTGHSLITNLAPGYEGQGLLLPRLRRLQLIFTLATEFGF